MPDKKEPIRLDPKTEAVIKRKGYVVKELLSEGSYGKVYKAQKKSDLIFAAVKVMDTLQMKEPFLSTFLPRELQMLAVIKHPYVLEVFDIFKSNKKIFIFMEFAPNGSLAEQCLNGPPPLHLSKKWVRQSAEALAYMHDKQDICHRDIKLENILLNPVFDAKVSDFGFTRFVGGSLARTACGTTAYYSPELSALAGQGKGQYDPKLGYDPKLADVWALGCVLFALCLARLPFADFPGKMVNGKAIPPSPDTFQTYIQSQKQRAYKKREGYKKLPADIRDLIEKCMEPDPTRRLTAAQLAAHKTLIK